MTGKKVARHTLTGDNINFSRLGTVPHAGYSDVAENAVHASTADGAANANTANNATHADNADLLDARPLIAFPGAWSLHAHVPAGGRIDNPMEVGRFGGLEVGVICHAMDISGVVYTNVLFTNQSNESSDINWFYTDGSTTHASGKSLNAGSGTGFDFAGGRIQGQFIYSNGATGQQVVANVLLWDGGSYCEVTGTLTGTFPGAP